MKCRSAFLILSVVFAAKAQLPEGPNRFYEGEGRIVTFRIVPGDRSAKLFFLGRKSGEIGFQRDAKLISVTALVAGKTEKLQFKDDGSSYVIAPLPEEKDLTLSLKAEIRGSLEDVKIRMKKP